MTRFQAWRQIQRQRFAHWIYPDAFDARWTPRTIAQAQQDDELRRQMEALDRAACVAGPTVRHIDGPVIHPLRCKCGQC